MPGEALARVRGLPNIPSITEVNVRSGPNTNHDLVFKVPVGMSGQIILEVQIDSNNTAHEGKVYQWFKLQFDGGAVGWVRDDLLEIEGDCTHFGYPDLSERTFAFTLTRHQANAPTQSETPAQPETSKPTGAVWQAPGPTTEPVMAPTLVTGGFPDAVQDLERVRKVAFLITASWEGGFRAINTYDSGIVSYGFLQFTLAGGSLISVIQKFVSQSESETAQGLRNLLPRIEARDPLLRNDQAFLNLLRTATDEQTMIDAQYAVGTEGYWQKVVDGYITSRQLRYPLTWALLFDMGVNFGVNHGFVRLAERDMGVPSRSNPALTGLGEEQLMTYVAQLRKRSHDRQAQESGFYGLAKRGNFWMDLCTAGDWYLQGNKTGQFVSNGRIINARNP
ncbi:MAG: SH3 domain-containing protein [Anaerolineae bacterium]